MANKTATPKAPVVPPKVPTYADLSPEELKDLALEQGKVLTGDETPEQLIEMLTGENVQANTEAEKAPAKSAPKAPAKPSIPEAILDDGEVLPGVLMDAGFYKEHFEKSEKVRVIIPLGIGEAKEHKDSSGKVRYPVEVCSINGYAISIRKGVYLNVPKEFAEIIERYTNFQIESPVDLTLADSATQNALS